MAEKVVPFPKLHREEQKVLDHLHKFGTTIPEILANIQKDNVERQKRADAIRAFLNKLGPATRVYMEYSKRYGRYYTAQYLEAPGYLSFKILKALSNNMFTVKQSNIGARSDGALLHPEQVKIGIRINVYINQ